MSLEAWGDEGDCAPDGYISEEQHDEELDDAFVRGARACREMLARFVDAQDPVIAMSIRANWHPGWGPDPGRPDDVDTIKETTK